MRYYHILFLLACLFLCSECTVEKRLYTKGWNVQLKKNYSSSKESVEENAILLNPRNELSVANEIDDVQLVDSFNLTEEISEEKMSLQELAAAPLSSIQKQQEHPITSLKTTIKSTKEKIESENRAAGQAFVPWLVLLIVGAVFIILSILLIYVGPLQNPDADLGSQLASAFLGVLMMIVGIILFLIGLIGSMVVNFQ
ncbi:MAG: hypothetical protein V4638_09490 [Bacteroidota bacterium]